MKGITIFCNIMIIVVSLQVTYNDVWDIIIVNSFLVGIQLLCLIYLKIKKRRV